MAQQGKRPTTSKATKVAGATLTELLGSWQRSLEARNLARVSVANYGNRVRRFITWRGAQGQSDELARVTKEDVQRYLIASLRTGAMPKSVSDYHGALSTFFKWCVEEGEIAQSPMAGIRAPIVPKNPPPMLRDDDLRALLATCEGPGPHDYLDRRDAALLRVLIDVGVRRGEIARMTMERLNLDAGEMTLYGKGRKDRTVVFHSKTRIALDRYLRARLRRPDADKPELWLGAKGPLTDEGIYQIVKRRARQADITINVWPHLLRHGWGHQFLAEGGQEHALAKMAGWVDTKMAGVYGASLAEERAREAAKKMKGGDRL